MSLSEAVLSIADDMEKDSGGEVDPACWKWLVQGYIRQLRSAVKAVENTARQYGVDPLVQHRQAIDAARAQIRAERVANEASGESLLKEEEQGGRSAVLMNGPLAGTSVQIPITMPAEAKIGVAGKVYQMGKDGKLWLTKEE